jgi:hypothetical protein
MAREYPKCEQFYFNLGRSCAVAGGAGAKPAHRFSPSGALEAYTKRQMVKALKKIPDPPIPGVAGSLQKGADAPDDPDAHTHLLTIWPQPNCPVPTRNPWDDSEFHMPGDQGEAGRMDLLTVMMHELGHILGFENGDTGVMSETLTAGGADDALSTPDSVLEPVSVPGVNDGSSFRRDPLTFPPVFNAPTSAPRLGAAPQSSAVRMLDSGGLHVRTAEGGATLVFAPPEFRNRLWALPPDETALSFSWGINLDE